MAKKKATKKAAKRKLAAKRKAAKPAKKATKRAKAKKKPVKKAVPPSPPLAVQWTRDGKPIGRVVISPPGANDVCFVWGKSFVEAWWTRDGRRMAPLPVPRGANDAHLEILPQ